MRKSPHFVLLMLLGTSVPLVGADLSMEGAVQAALMSNRPLAAAKFEINKAKARLLQAGLLPNPEFEFAGMSDLIAQNEGEGGFSVGLSQTFPITSRLTIARELSRFEVAKALREIRDQERLLIAEVQSRYVQVQAARLIERAAMEARQSSVGLVDLTEKRLAAGQGSLAEGALLRVEERKWWTESTNAKTITETKLLELKTLLGIPADSPLNLTESLESIAVDLRQSLPGSGDIQRPDVDLALLEIDQAGAELRLARAEAWEGVTLGLEYTYDRAIDEPEGMGTSKFFGIRVSVPLPLWNTGRGAIKEGLASKQQAQARVRAVELEVGNAIALMVRKTRLYEDQLENYRTTTEGIVASSEKELASGFEQGRVDLRDLLQIRAQIAHLRIDGVTILENVVLALIEWQAATGGHPTIRRPYTEAKPQKSNPKQ